MLSGCRFYAPIDASVAGEGGSYDSFREWGQSDGKIGDFDYSVAGSRLDTDNDRPNNNYRNTAGIANVGWSPDQQVRIGGLFTYSFSDTGNPNTIFDPNQQQTNANYGKITTRSDPRVNILAMTLEKDGQLHMVVDNHVHGAAGFELGDLDAEQLLDRRAVAEVVDQRRDVVEPVRVGDRVVVRARLAVLLEGPVEVADLHVGLHHRLAVQLREDTHDAVHRGMGRAHVDVEVLAPLAASAPLAQEQLARVGHRLDFRSDEGLSAVDRVVLA